MSAAPFSDVRLGTVLDILLFAVAACATIAGTTPPAKATADSKARAKSSGGDFIQRAKLSSVWIVYAFHAGCAAVMAAHVHALWTASLSRPPAAQPIAPAPASVLSSVAARFWADKQAAAAVTHGAVARSTAAAWLAGGDTTSTATRAVFRVACVVATLGGIARVVCFRQLGHFFTFDLAVHDKHKVIDTGLYGIVRHPSYTAILLNSSAFAVAIACGPLITPSRRPIAQTIAVAHCVVLTLPLVCKRMRDEEAMLTAEMGDSYKKYKQTVTARLIPGLY